MARLLKFFPETEDTHRPHGNAPWIGVRVDLGGGDSAYIVDAGATLGHFRDIDIPEWVSTSDGKVYRFEGVCGAIEDASFRDGLLTLPPGLFMR
jgi:hypothetical protein